MSLRECLRFNRHRYWALLWKECLQIKRDSSALIIGLFLPVFMLLIYGYGISFDMKNVPIAIVLEDQSSIAQKMVVDFLANPHFKAHVFHNLTEAELAFESHDVDAVLTIPNGFTRDLLSEHSVQLGLTIYGVDSQSALIFKSYIAGVIQNSIQKMQLQGVIGVKEHEFESPKTIKKFSIRSWFNEANNSTWYIVPGLLVLVTGISGGLMCAIIIAREWERGTMPALFATATSSLEIFLSKWTLYWLITLIGSLLCSFVAALLFTVPCRGSIWTLFLLLVLLAGWSSLLGLFLSAKTKSQFLATEATVIFAFLPSLMLSGFLFDLRSVPVWIEVIGQLLPPTYAMEALKQIFLAGDGNLIWTNVLVLMFWILLLALATIQALSKKTQTIFSKKKGRL